MGIEDKEKKPYQPTEEELKKANEAMTDDQRYASNQRSEILTGNSEVLDSRDLDRVPEIKATKESVHLDYGPFHYVEYSDPKRRDWEKVRAEAWASFRNKEISHQDALDLVESEEKRLRGIIDKLEAAVTRLQENRQEILDTIEKNKEV